MISHFLCAKPDGVVSCLIEGSTIENSTLTEKMNRTLSAEDNQREGGNGAIVNKLDKNNTIFLK